MQKVSSHLWFTQIFYMPTVLTGSFSVKWDSCSVGSQKNKNNSGVMFSPLRVRHRDSRVKKVSKDVDKKGGWGIIYLYLLKPTHLNIFSYSGIFLCAER